MPNKSSQIFLPPMSHDLLEYVELCEESAHRNLSDSFRRGSLDVGKATTILATFVVSVVDGQIANYSRLHNYDPHWTNEIVQSAIRSAEGLIGSISDRYEQFITPKLERIISEHLKAKAQKQKTPAIPSKITRTKLRDSYFANFPDETIKILDVCWAVSQHYREWKRWLKNELRDGSTPDLAFRKILTSGKRPLEFNKKPRPPKWQ
ncbi:MAG: hypothetical protein WA672_15830 [Candidatus Angelobacter sp.]